MRSAHTLHRPLIAVTAATAAVALATTACGTFRRWIDPPSSSACDTDSSTNAPARATTPSGGKAATIALLVDTTTLHASDSSKELEKNLKEDRDRAVDTVLEAGFAQKATLYVGYISGPGRARLAAEPFPLKREGVNPLDCKESERTLSKKVKDAVDVPSTAGPTDVLGGLTMLNLSLDRSSSETNLSGGTDNLSGGADRPGLDVVILSSMLNQTESLTPEAEQQDPDAVIPKLRQDNSLRDCTGWRVYLVGPGRTSRESLGGTSLNNLQRFWQSAFQACGGELWGFQPQLTPFPAAAPLPAPPKVCGKQVIPASVLFDTGKADIRPDAEPWLNQIIDSVRTSAEGDLSGTVEVTGHTDSDGEPTTNQTLSEQRAQSVAGRIGSELPGLRIEASGLGETVPMAANDTPEHKAQNRRVEVTVFC